MKGLKQAVKPWSKSTYGNFQDKQRHNLDKINYVEGKLVDAPMNHRLNDWLNRLIKQREKMLLFNQKFWRRFARKDWLVNGDQNSTYFQWQANRRRKRQDITRLKDEVGIWLEDPQDIQQKFMSDFISRFQSAQNIPRIFPHLGLITDQDNDMLTDPVYGRN